MKLKAGLIIVAVLALSMMFGPLGMATPGASQLDARGAKAVGARYETPQGPATITRDQAISIAQKRLGALASKANTVEAHYILFSDDQYSTPDVNGGTCQQV